MTSKATRRRIEGDHTRTTPTLIHQRQSGEVHYAAPGFDATTADSHFTETNPLCGDRLMGGVVPVAEVRPYALCRRCEMAQGLADAGRLRETSAGTLLTDFAALTHRIHTAQVREVTRHQQGVLADLRAQRDLIRAEILRRTGDTR